jgi:hypothetical protein
MTVREQLHNWVDVLDDARAAALLADLESEFADDEFPAFTSEELERIQRSVGQIRAGQTIPIDEIREYFGIAR